MKDTNPKKVNLTIGAYKDENANPWTLNCVKNATKILLEKSQHQYLPPIGDKEFTKLAVEIAYGKDSNGLLAGNYKNSQIVQAQCLSGAGGILLFFNVLKEFYEPLKDVGNKIYVSTPTWPNHSLMAELQGLKPAFYNYYDLKKRRFDYEGMIKSLKSIPEYSPIIFHPVGHNPTGFDPSHEQWDEILDISKERKFFNCFDMAYQGFVSGDLEKDAYAVQLFAKNKLPIAVIQSFAKNFGLYGHRIGCFSIPNEDETFVKNMNDFLNIRIRRLYSSNPRYGSDIIKTVLQDSKLRQQWFDDIKKMSLRMIQVRKLLLKELKNIGAKGDWEYITKQQGMFAYTHITKEQAIELREKYSIYMLELGRVSVSGLTEHNVKYVAESFKAVTDD